MDAFFLIVILHVTVIVPFLLWVGFNRAATPEWMYSALFGTGLLVLVYHSYKAITRLLAASPVVWINLIHVLVVAPLLLCRLCAWYRDASGPQDHPDYYK